MVALSIIDETIDEALDDSVPLLAAVNVDDTGPCENSNELEAIPFEIVTVANTEAWLAVALTAPTVDVPWLAPFCEEDEADGALLGV